MLSYIYHIFIFKYVHDMEVAVFVFAVLSWPHPVDTSFFELWNYTKSSTRSCRHCCSSSLRSSLLRAFDLENETKIKDIKTNQSHKDQWRMNEFRMVAQKTRRPRQFTPGKPRHVLVLSPWMWHPGFISAWCNFYVISGRSRVRPL